MPTHSSPYPKVRNGRIGSLVRRYRQLFSLTQQQLAERAGLTQGYIAKIESGAADMIRSDKVQALADALGITEKVMLEASRQDKEATPPSDELVLESGRRIPVRVRPGAPTRELYVTPEVAAILDQLARQQEITHQSD